LQYEDSVIICEIVTLMLVLFINYFFIIIRFKVVALSNILNDTIILIAIKFDLLIINDKEIIIINVSKTLSIVRLMEIAIVIYLYLELIKELTATFPYNKYFAKLYK